MQERIRLPDTFRKSVSGETKSVLVPINPGTNTFNTTGAYPPSGRTGGTGGTGGVLPPAQYTGENGRLPESSLASIGNGIKIRSDAAAAWNRMASAARAAGINLAPSSGYRTYEHQLRLWQDALAKYESASAARKWVAPPGDSNHGWGIAVDEGVIYKNRSPSNPHYRWLSANASKFNFYQRMSWEPWHWEYRGG